MKGKNLSILFAREILLNYQETIKELAETIGVTVSLFRVVSYSQIYHRALARFEIHSLARPVGNFDRRSYISEEAANVSKWLVENIFDASAPIKLQPIDYVIFLKQN